MKAEEYLERLDEIEERARQETLKLAHEYARSVNPYKAGDIVEDYIGKAQIICHGIYYGNGLARNVSIRYWCTSLTKSGKPAKRSPQKRFVYYYNIKDRKPLLGQDGND